MEKWSVTLLPIGKSRAANKKVTQNCSFLLVFATLFNFKVVYSPITSLILIQNSDSLI